VKNNGRVRVVVTGMGTVNPLGKSLDEYWDGLIEGPQHRPHGEGSYSTEKLTTKFACEVHGFDPTQYMDRKTAQRMARFRSWRWRRPSMALEDSGLDLSKEDDFRVGVDMGTGIGGFIEMTGGAISYATKGRLNPLYAPMIIPEHGGRVGRDGLPPSRSEHDRHHRLCGVDPHSGRCHQDHPARRCGRHACGRGSESLALRSWESRRSMRIRRSFHAQ